MPYEQHKVFDTPRGRTVIWRYVSLSKFVSMLTTQTLWFAGLLHLDDPFEGAETKMDALVRRASIELARRESPEVPAFIWDGMESGAHDQQMHRLLFASSWHMARHETEVMWWRYVKPGDGVAI